mmetsp:Transcript_63765/g.176868  ORF Transcript_63765/g.176868 Transcript_63765/m.176868 type:complete len:218 (+) Transcript_63765:3-656(+)
MDPLQWLVHARANPVLRNRESRTPAEVAARNRAEDAAALLLRHERRHRWRGVRGRGEITDQTEGSESEDVLSGMPSSPGPKALRQAGQYRSEEDSGSGTETDEPEPSLALVVVRAARPLLRGVQWLANRVLGERKTDLGQNNRFCYDSQTGQWVLRKPSKEHRDSSDIDLDPDDSATSAASDTDEEPPRSSRPSMPRRLRLMAGRRASDSEGAPGAV